MIKFYDITDEGGGGGGPVAPKGYAVTTPVQRSDWNSFLDYVGKANVDFDKNPAAAATLMAQYKKTNPNFSLTPNDIQRIQYEQYQLRKGDKFGNLSLEQLKYLRQGLPDNYLNRPIPDANGQFNGATAKLYYPQKTVGDKSYGTDIEGYVNSVGGQPKVQSVSVTNPVAQPPISTAPAGVARPDFNDPKSRLNYLKALAAQPGNSFLHGRGDYLLNVNKIPQYGTKTFHDSAVDAAKKVGLDPALLYSSAQEEGASGLVPDEKGEIRTADGLSEDYPVSGYANFGLDNFHDNFKEMVRRGYLPKDFDYKPERNLNEQHQYVNSAVFRNTEDAMKAKAAYVKLEQDNLEDWAKKNKVDLTPTAKQFFTLIAFNGGPGRAHILINHYKKRGLLEGEKYLQTAPDKEADPGGAWGHTVPRVQMANLLKKEAYFQ